MDVKLYVYDLTKGMAKSMSRSLLGIQIDAVYHTSLVFNGVETFFGQGIQTCYPGSTHHGAPMEIVHMGETQLPAEVIQEYIEAMRDIYTPESYDLFAHNCNNFTNDLSMFLVGKGIPDHITSLPQTVLNTPFGQMLKPQLDASMRSITQAPVPPQNVPRPPQQASKDVVHPPVFKSSGVKAAAQQHGSVYNVTSLSVLNDLLSGAKETCAVIFFTSSTCSPCKIAYPTYDSLASEQPRATFIKVDINAAHDIARQYQIRATPTFMTFLHNNKENEWTGANPPQLRGNVGLLIEQAFLTHIHARLQVPSLRSGSLRPVSFTKIPPLDKVIAKMGEQGRSSQVGQLKAFIETRSKEGAREATLPDLPSCASFLQSAPSIIDKDVLFTAYDLLRCALLDGRVSGWFAEESAPAQSTTITTLLKHVIDLTGSDACPFNLRLVALQLGCNLFTSPLSIKSVFSSHGDLSFLLVQLATASLLAERDRPAVRASAASLAFNLASANYRIRREEEREALPEAAQVELAAGLLEFLGDEGALAERPSAEPLQAALLALGYLVYYTPVDGELWDLCKVMDAKGMVSGLKGITDVKKSAGEIVLCLPNSG